jgi:hypothetical protein
VAESAVHLGHDPLQIAAAVDRGARLAPVLELCLRCAALYADLVALTAALPLAVGPVRPRDFTLSADDAHRLGRRGWRGWWSAVGSARDTVTRPLAVSFSTLGLVGLLLTTVPSFLPMAGSGATSTEADAKVFTITAGPAASPAPADVPSVDVETLSPMVPWLGLLAIGGGLFAARRVAAHGRPIR